MIRESHIHKYDRLVEKSLLKIIVILGVSAGILLVYLNRNLWFYGDDFSIIFDRYFQSKDFSLVDAVLKPHNEHPIIIPTIVYLIIENIFGLHHYWIFVVPVLFMHVTITICVGILLSKILESKYLVIAGVAAMGFASAGVENLFWAFQFGFIGAIACGLIHLVLVFDDQPKVGKRDYWGALFGIFAVLNPATALTSLFVVGCYLIIRRRWMALLIAIGPALIVFLSWRIIFGSEENHPKPDPHQLLALHQYVWRGLTASSDGLLHLSGIGVIVLVAIGTYCVLQSQRNEKYSLVAALMLGLVFFYTVNGLGRIQYGVEQATSSRYTYIGVTLLTIPFLVVIDFVFAHKRTVRMLAHLMIIWFVIIGAMEFLNHSRSREINDRQRFGNMSAAIELSLTQNVRLDAQPSPELDPTVSVTHLLRAQDEGLWPTRNFNRRNILDTTNRISVTVQPTEETSVNPTHQLSGYINVQTPLIVDECLSFIPYVSPQIAIVSNDESPIFFTSQYSGTLGISLRGTNGLRSTEIAHSVNAGQRYSITGWPPDTEIVLTLPANSTSLLCGVVKS